MAGWQGRRRHDRKGKTRYHRAHNGRRRSSAWRERLATRWAPLPGSYLTAADFGVASWP